MGDTTTPVSRHTHVLAHNLPDAVALSAAPTIADSAVISNCRFGRYTEVGEQVLMSDSLLDDYSYLCRHCELISADIGKFANIAAMVRINPGFHPMDRPSQHHFTYRRARYGLAETDDGEFFEWRRRQRVHIGHDTWIGHGAVIMPGVRIGNGAVVGSLAVVTRDLPAYAIAVGAPAKVLRYRFAPAIAQAIEATQWWDWPHEVLRQRLQDFGDLRHFLAKHGPRDGL